MLVTHTYMYTHTCMCAHTCMCMAAPLTSFNNAVIDEHDTDFDSVAQVTVTASWNAAAIIVMIKIGRSALLISLYSPDVVILCICVSNSRTRLGRQLRVDLEGGLERP